MASRVIHLAIAGLICSRAEISDSRRFLMGSIIPDAKMDSVLRNEPHFLRRLEGGKVCYGLKAFLALYGDRILSDDFYLGYYLHLIQDAEYRRFMYGERGWNSHTPGYVEKLHADYRKINRYLIEEFALENTLRSPAGFEDEDICLRFGFDLAAFLDALEEDFHCDENGEFSFFTPEHADGFIARALEVCLQELEALRGGLPLYDEEAKGWGGENGT